MFPLSTPRREVARVVASYRSALRSRASSERFTKEGGEAFESLLEPAMRDLPAGTELVFVPDRELHQLPLAALFDRRRGRYLIEDHPCLVTPSLGTYLSALDHPRPKGDFRRVLAVGDPEIDRSAFPTLAPLPSARREAQAIAALYPEPTLLLGPAASRSAILAALPGSEVVHFATHALVDAREPLASLVATADPGEAVLRASDLDAKSLAGVEFVFLSACDTAPGFADGDREGVAGLARAVLAAGVSSVVATLWPVDDQAISGLPETFHARLRAGDSPARALQLAQLALLQRTNSHALAWVPFQLFSGN
ncbi:MAG TPA: CHAT domain-containing protein [Thermoanaerobaculia bacterium]|nr:CHAT domain-containing protein [Thermoanaerobaculia bacterium]